jgi:hypothetical protein
MKGFRKRCAGRMWKSRLGGHIAPDKRGPVLMPLESAMSCNLRTTVRFGKWGVTLVGF